MAPQRATATHPRSSPTPEHALEAHGTARTTRSPIDTSCPQESDLDQMGGLVGPMALAAIIRRGRNCDPSGQGAQKSGFIDRNPRDVVRRGTMQRDSRMRRAEESSGLSTMSRARHRRCQFGGWLPTRRRHTVRRNIVPPVVCWNVSCSGGHSAAGTGVACVCTRACVRRGRPYWVGYLPTKVLDANAKGKGGGSRVGACLKPPY